MMHIHLLDKRHTIIKEPLNLSVLTLSPPLMEFTGFPCFLCFIRQSTEVPGQNMGEKNEQKQAIKAYACCSLSVRTSFFQNVVFLLKLPTSKF